METMSKSEKKKAIVLLVFAAMIAALVLSSCSRSSRDDIKYVPLSVATYIQDTYQIYVASWEIKSPGSFDTNETSKTGTISVLASSKEKAESIMQNELAKMIKPGKNQEISYQLTVSQTVYDWQVNNK